MSKVFEHISHLPIYCFPVMNANVLQAVFREAEAVAYCHRMQVRAE